MIASTRLFTAARNAQRTADRVLAASARDRAICADASDEMTNAENDYDSFAKAYAAENETSLNNAYYERPAMLGLIGDASGRRILDVGCGSGPLMVALRDRGAIVRGIDLSAGLLAEARLRLGPDADLQVADLSDPLPFDDKSFDDVIASLVLHYIEDWGPPLAELHRVLKTGGRLIASVHHPTADYCIERLAGNRPDYFSTYTWTDEWSMGGHVAQMSFWSRPLHAMTDAFAGAGFHISAICEPQPVPEARALFPEDFDLLATAPCFLFFVLHAT